MSGGSGATKRHLGGVLLLLVPAFVTAGPGDPCTAFTWEVAHERTLFAATPQLLAAAAAPDGAPLLKPERLYQLQLIAQAQVAFAAPPGKRHPSAEGYGGLVAMTLEQPGLYRVSLDQPAWVDVVAGGSVIAARDFQGRAGCNAPHKIVEFVLPAGVALTLQLSAATAPAVKIAVSRAPGQ
jgi:hypothetical protein